MRRCLRRGVVASVLSRCPGLGRRGQRVALRMHVGTHREPHCQLAPATPRSPRSSPAEIHRDLAGVASIMQPGPRRPAALVVPADGRPAFRSRASPPPRVTMASPGHFFRCSTGSVEGARDGETALAGVGSLSHDSGRGLVRRRRRKKPLPCRWGCAPRRVQRKIQLSNCRDPPRGGNCRGESTDRLMSVLLE